MTLGESRKLNLMIKSWRLRLTEAIKDMEGIPSKWSALQSTTTIANCLIRRPFPPTRSCQHMDKSPRSRGSQYSIATLRFATEPIPTHKKEQLQCSQPSVRLLRFRRLNRLLHCIAAWLGLAGKEDRILPPASELGDQGWSIRVISDLVRVSKLHYSSRFRSPKSPIFEQPKIKIGDNNIDLDPWMSMF